MHFIKLIQIGFHFNRSLFFFAAFVVYSISSYKAKAQINMPPSFNHSLISVGWDNPVGITYDNNGRGYVWERSGKVWIVDTNGVKQTNPLIDIYDEVGNWRAHGMLGFALDPNFLTNGYIYLYYAVDRYALLNWGLPNYKKYKSITYEASIGRITRYKANVSTGFTTVNLNSRLVLLGESKSTGIPLLHESHGVGSLLFGSDGSLLVSVGDGASYSVVDTGSAVGTYWAQALQDTIITPKENIGNLRSQLVDCLNGKILRLNPANGNGLPTNPYYDPAHPRAAKSRVWTLGLRNPFRITLQPNTGSTDITAGQPGTILQCEVGWATWEETNMITQGGMNLGWPFFEGINNVGAFDSTKIANMDAPNPLFGNGVCNKPFFYFNDLIKQASLNSSNTVFKNSCDTSLTVPAGIPVFIHTPPMIIWKHDTAITQAPLLAVDSTISQDIGGTSGITGIPFSGNCSVAGTFYNGTKFPVNYQGSFFNADYGKTWIKQFSFNSNNQLININPFADSVGAITCLTVNPKSGCLVYVTLPDAVHQICYTANVNLPPISKITLTDTANYGVSPLTLHFNGLQSYDPENAITNYNWKFGDGTSANGSSVTHTFSVTTGLPKKYTVKLIVTDNTGQKGTDSITVSINNTPPQVHIISPINGSYYPITQPSAFNCIANVIDVEHNDASLVYKWITILHHNNHSHPEPTDYDHITTTILSVDGCDEPYYYEQLLTVTDPAGLSTTDTVLLYPRCAVPDITFTADKTDICIADTVHFTNTSFNGLNYQWSFAGGTVTNANQNNATVYYPTAGDFLVSLKACNSIGCDTLIKANWIHVGNPIANITSSGSTICLGDSLKLNAQNGTGYSFQWFKNSAPIAGATSSSYYAKTSGSYKVSVFKSNGCSSMSSSISITVNPIPNATITPNGVTTFCQGNSVILSANAASAYLWSSGATTQSITVSVSGNYAVTVTSNGCISAPSATTIVTVQTCGGLYITAGGSTTFCAGNNVVLTSSLPTNNLWSNGATTQSTAVIVSGIYSCTNSGSTSNLIAVTVNPKPAASFTSTGLTTYCANSNSLVLNASTGTNLTYQWLRDGNLVTPAEGGNNPQFYPNATGSFKVVESNQFTCRDTSTSIAVTVLPIPSSATATAQGATTFCDGGSVVLSANILPNVTYQWKKTGVSITGATSANYTATAAGGYKVQVIGINGCFKQSTPAINITVNPKPTATITPGGTTTFCQGGSVTLAANAASNYLWSTGATAQSISVAASGNYWVTVTNASACTAVATPVIVTINPLPSIPVITASGTTTFCFGQSVTLTAAASNANSYLWNTGNTTQAITVGNEGTYTVTAFNNCGSASSIATFIDTINCKKNKFTRSIGDSSTYEYVSQVKATIDNGNIYCGSTKVSGFTNEEFFLLKTDSFGAIQSYNVYGDSALQLAVKANSLAGLSDNSVIICGQAINPNKSSDAVVMKVSSAGKIIWQKAWGGTKVDYGRSVIVSSDANLIIAGKSKSSSLTNFDLFLAKYDTAGNMLWSKGYGGALDEDVKSVRTARSGGYLLAGSTYTNSAGDRDLFMIKTNDTGSVVWGKTYGGLGSDNGIMARTGIDNGYIFCGETNSSGAGSIDIVVLKTDNNGNLLWSKTYGTSADEHASSLIATSTGNYILAGDQTFVNGTYNNIALMLDLSGNIVEQYTLASNNKNRIYSLNENADSSITYAGGIGDTAVQNILIVKTGKYPHESCIASSLSLVVNTASLVVNNLTTTYNYGSSVNMTKFKLVTQAIQNTVLCDANRDVSLSTNSADKNSLSVIPNPTTGLFVIKFNSEINSKAELKIYDAIGNLFFSKAISATKGENTIDINLSSAPVGIYFIALTKENGIISQKMIKN